MISSLKCWLVLKSWSRISSAARVVHQALERRLRPRVRRDEPLQVRQRHAGVGAPGQDRVQGGREPRQHARGRAATRQVPEVAEPALDVADPQAGQPAPGRLGVVEQDPGPVEGREW